MIQTPLSADLIAKIRRLEITSAKLVEEMFAGKYQSVFKGRGIEFSDVRDYQWGDDIRAMHWKAMARFAGKPFIKRFTEERELTVILAVDVSGSQNFGSGERTKREIIQDVAGTLAYLAMKNKDRVGLLLFSDRTELYLPARGGRFHALRILRELVGFAPASQGTDIKIALTHLLQMVKKKAIVFLISDFWHSQDESDFSKELAILAKKHDVIAVTVDDPAEAALADIPAIVSLEDPETGALHDFDLRRTDLREILGEETQRHQNQLDLLFKRCGIDRLELSTLSDFAEALIELFKKRERRKLSGR